MRTQPENYCLFFTQCILCHDPAPADTGLCQGCLDDLPWIDQHCPSCALPQDADHLCRDCLSNPPPFNRVEALFDYRFPVNQLISRIKYHNQPTLIGALAKQLAVRLQHAPRPDLLVPIPMHPSRLRERGYNQAELLARLLGRLLGCPVSNTLLKRTRSTVQQMGLPRQERLANLRGSFSATSTRCRHIALIDDVMTTGTTLREACNTLRNECSAEIDVWVAVRTAADH